MRWHPIVIGLVGALMAMAFAGCRSADMSSAASFASTVISGRTSDEIERASTAVFRAEGYSVIQAYGGDMVFEKDASRTSQIAYSSVGGGFYGEQVKDRVKAQIVPLAGGRYRLECKAFIVRRADSEFYTEEVPLTNIRSRPYQKLLNQVASQLKSKN
jgi:hypothetical protein